MENAGLLHGRCTELESIIADLRRQLNIEAEHVSALQHAAEHSEQHIGQLMADNDDLRAQLRVCILNDCEFVIRCIETLYERHML